MADNTALRAQVAKAIRDAVQLRIGPNAREILERGGTMPLTPGEADDAADAALNALTAAGYQLMRQITPAEEAADAALWADGPTARA